MCSECRHESRPPWEASKVEREAVALHSGLSRLVHYAASLPASICRALGCRTGFWGPSDRPVLNVRTLHWQSPRAQPSLLVSRPDPTSSLVLDCIASFCRANCPSRPLEKPSGVMSPSSVCWQYRGPERAS